MKEKLFIKMPIGNTIPLGEQTNLEDDKGFILKTGDLVFCQLKHDKEDSIRYFMSIVIKDEEKYFILGVKDAKREQLTINKILGYEKLKEKEDIMVAGMEFEIIAEESDESDIAKLMKSIIADMLK